MPDTDSLQQARQLLGELLEAARAGTLIPVRLPAQIEAIDSALAKAQEECAKAAANPAPAPDSADSLKEQAYFVSHAVHELRTPLTSIRGYSDMLATPALGALSDMQKQFLDTIRANTKRMEGLLTDVSDTSKIRGGALRRALKMDTFKNIALMVEKATAPQAEQTGRKLAFDIPSGLPILETDGELLAKALTKLVENGLRYTPQDGGEVTVSGAAEDNTLVITVRDNGIGMTPEEIAQLGTVYFRSENEAVRAHKGSGLGIPVAYGIIKLLDGTVSVDSTPGQGTTFTVRLKGMG